MSTIFANAAADFDALGDYQDFEGDEREFFEGGMHMTTLNKSSRVGGIDGEVTYDGDAAADEFAEAQLSAMLSNPADYQALQVKKGLKRIVDSLPAGTGARTATAVECISHLGDVEGRNLSHLLEVDCLSHALAQAVRTDATANPAQASDFAAQAMAALPAVVTRRVAGEFITHDPAADLRGRLMKVTVEASLNETFGQVIFEVARQPVIAKPARRGKPASRKGRKPQGKSTPAAARRNRGRNGKAVEAKAKPGNGRSRRNGKGRARKA